MDGVASLGHVGAVVSQAQVRSAEPAPVASAVQGQGSAALTLIQASVVNASATGHDLDVLA
jgi:hypothetical protein